MMIKVLRTSLSLVFLLLMSEVTILDIPLPHADSRQRQTLVMGLGLYTKFHDMPLLQCKCTAQMAKQEKMMPYLFTVTLSYLTSKGIQISPLQF